MIALIRNGRFRPPVLSRLAWAWVAFAIGAATFSVYAYLKGDNNIARIALPVSSQIERLAPPLARPAEMTSTPVQTAAGPPLRDAALEPFSVEAEDTLASLSEDALIIDGAFELLDQNTAEEVIITIDGAPARSPGDKTFSVSSAVPVSLSVEIPAASAAMLATTNFGAVPKIAGDGRKASRVYARPFTAPTSTKRVALIVGGLGLDRSLTERAIDDLPPEVTLAFAPYGKDLKFWTEKARRAGHEIMIELPMENRNGVQTALGSAALLTTRTDAENMQRLDWLLSRFGGYFAATNYLGSKFSSDNAAMSSVLRKLKSAGVAYYDDTGAVSRFESSQAGDFSVVHRMISSARSDSGQIAKDFAALEQLAERDGAALGKAYAYSSTMAEIIEWTQSLREKDIALAPASSLLHDGNDASL